MKPYDLVVFDWEGTLSDSVGLIIQYLQQAASDIHAGSVDEKKAKSLLSYDARTIVEELFPHLAAHQILELVNKFRYYYAKNIEQVKLFPGVKALIEKLHKSGCLLAIASGKSAHGLSLAIEHVQMQPYFFSIKTPCDAPAKPNPRALDEIMTEAEIDKKKMVMVGDSVCDMTFASNFGIDAIACNFDGQTNEDALLSAGAIEIVNSVAQLSSLLFPDNDS